MTQLQRVQLVHRVLDAYPLLAPLAPAHLFADAAEPQARRPGRVAELVVSLRGATLTGVSELRPTWTVRTPAGTALTVEYDTLRDRWRVDPGGYERRGLADVLGQATGTASSANWIVEIAERLVVEAGAQVTE